MPNGDVHFKEVTYGADEIATKLGRILNAEAVRRRRSKRYPQWIAVIADGRAPLAALEQVYRVTPKSLSLRLVVAKPTRTLIAQHTKAFPKTPKKLLAMIEQDPELSIVSEASPAFGQGAAHLSVSSG